MFSPDSYVSAMRFAATAHSTQKVPGHDLPYLVHVVSVASEVIAALPDARLRDPDLAVTCALLHDTVEDTPTSLADITAQFGVAVAAGVAALTKDPTLPKVDQMADSLRRILVQPEEIAAVKLADRITNLAAPPSYWSKDKCAAYRREALTIVEALGDRCPALASRLHARIAAYLVHC